MKFDSIQSFNEFTKVRAPKHDLIDLGEYPRGFLSSSAQVYPNFFRISLKKGLENDKEKWFMYFSSPGQAIEWKTDSPWEGYFINLKAALISTHQHLAYSFLEYGQHEPLILKQEEAALIRTQYQAALTEYDKRHFSMNLLLAYINLIFAHVAQCYERQFGEEKEQNNPLTNAFFTLLEQYYNGDQEVAQPSVHYFASQLNVTPNYLSDLIRFYSGKSALEHIHQHIVKVAKPLLSKQQQSVSEIAYQLGFEYPNYFARLFRKITGVSPSQFSKL